MSNDFFDKETYDGENFSITHLQKGEYENCTFNNCHFAQTDLSGFVFADCLFDHCDLSMAVLRNTTFRDVKFSNCKLLGLRFDECNSFLISFEFENCILNLSSFYKLKLKNSLFTNCKLHEADFVETDLTGSTFQHCDFNNAVFERTILEKADFRTSINFIIDPENNKINKAMFSLQTVRGLLTKYQISIE